MHEAECPSPRQLTNRYGEDRRLLLGQLLLEGAAWRAGSDANPARLHHASASGCERCQQAAHVAHERRQRQPGRARLEQLVHPAGQHARRRARAAVLQVVQTKMAV